MNVSQYNKIIRQIKAYWPDKIEQRLETGRLTGLALALGKALEDVSIDTGISVAMLRQMVAVSQFWGTDRIHGCFTWHHYYSVAHAGDVKRKQALIKGGHALCVQSTVDDSGTTKSHRNKVANIESAVNTAIVTLASMRTALTQDQVDNIQARVDVLTGMLAKRAPLPPQPIKKHVGLREWASSMGYSVGARGRISHVIQNAYQAHMANA